MTATEFYNKILEELRSHHTTTLTPLEFNELVDTMLYQWVQTRFYAFEQYQKSIDDLEKIVVVTNGEGGMPNPLPNLGKAIPGKEFFVLDDKVFLVNVRFFMSAGSKCKRQEESAQLKKTDFVSNKNSYDKPSNTNIFYQQYDGRIWRYDTGKSDRIAEKAIVTYLRKPVIPRLDENGNSLIDPEFDDRICNEQIKFIVQTYLERIKEPRQRSFQADNAGVYNIIAPAAKK